MTPPAAAATVAGRSHARRPARNATPRTARRVSGPARTPRHGSIALPAGAVLAPPLALRVARRVASLPDARVLDRLIRGRLWIGLLAVGLIGIVFMQISLLKLNTGIGRAVQTAQTLGDQNASIRAELSRMAGGARVEERAQAKGYVVPATGQPLFLDARRTSAARAAAAITPPAPVRQLPLGMISPEEGGTAGVAPITPLATAGQGQPAAAGATTPTATATAAVAPAATAAAPPQTGAPPQTTPVAPAAAAPTAQTPVAAPVTASPPPSSAAAASGGGLVATPQG